MNKILFNFVAVVVFFVCSSFAKDLELNLLPDGVAAGAVCLDGSQPGYYFRAGTGSGGKKWIIFLQGGGWCYDLDECVSRSKTDMGSTKNWKKTTVFGSGPMSDDPKKNPEFHNWNVAFLPYCDGASFSGNADEPVKHGDTTLHFRGIRVLTHILNELIKKRDLKSAEHALLSGCSAGGLSTYLHADYVATFFSSKTVYKALPVSGFFLLHSNVDNKAVYPNRMENVFKMQNSTSGTNADCIKSTPQKDQWKCIFANYNYRHIKTPIFVLNSMYDSWQMGNILGVDNKEFLKCAGGFPTNCTSEQIKIANKFKDTLLEEIRTSPTFKSEKNGVFLDSCWKHCAEQSSGWTDILVDGKPTYQVVAEWFYEHSRPPHNHIDCSLHENKPYACNPSCHEN